MENTVATLLIKNTFTQSFDENRFRNFVINLLNKIDESKAFSPIQGQYIKDAFKNHIRQYKRIGTYTDPEGLKIDVMIVYLHRESALDHARTMQRNFMVDYLKNRDQKDAALVAYVGEDKTDWRFSLVRMEYKTIQTESGKVKVKEDFTPARRYSFLGGENEPNHTAQVQLLPILADSQKNPTLDKLETAFNIESVTKEFFDKYKELFLQLKDELDGIATGDKTIQTEFARCEIDTAAFAKKLLGQIVFLYFLQKKGWMGVQPGKDWGTGSKNFLADLFDKKFGNYQNFFHDMLEPLFYKALAVERKDNLYTPLNCRIPFLNGGLFEPVGGYEWEKIQILIADKIFKTIFETFNLYNFTVREDEPLEREVAVDPEMLGKVFENLLEVKDRKSKGAFYTPREIVHYMCEEVLINYIDSALNFKEAKQDIDKKDGFSCEMSSPVVLLEDIRLFIRHGEVAANYDSAKENGTITYSWKLPETIRNNAIAIDKILANIKICDPAIGSGAFPVGMMSEIIKARKVLSTYMPADDSRTPYNFKRHAIETNIYGVDVDSSAVDIARLRLWLSLVVDEDDFLNITPLPNLDYKIVEGNSLLGVEKNIFNFDLVNKLEEIKDKYFGEYEKTRKAKYKTEIDSIISQLTNNKKIFDFELYFSEVFHINGGFDIIIANPPYVGEKGHKDEFRVIRNGPLQKFYQAKMDLFYFFFHLALNLSKMGSQIAFISTNYFVTATGARVLRRDLYSRATIKTMIDFNELKIFESAMGQHNMITIFSRGSSKNANAHNCQTKMTGIATHTLLQNIFSGDDKDTEYFTVTQKELYDGVEYYIRLSGKRDSENSGGNSLNHILNKVAKNRKLNEFCNINSGCDVTISRITASHLRKFHGDFREGDGVFVITQEEILHLGITGQEVLKLKNYIKNSEIFKFGVSIGGDKLIYLRWEDDISKYPILRRHLQRFKEILEDQSNRYEEDYPWFALHRPRNQEIFDSEQKILVPYRSKSNIFGYTCEKIYSSRDVFFITPKNEKAMPLKYVLAVLNSKLIYVWLYYRGKRKGETLEMYQQPLSEIPIIAASSIERDNIISITDRIISLKRGGSELDTTLLEQQIDHLVYKIYGLTSEESRIVDEFPRPM